MREKGQLNRFNKTEYGLMRSLFKENDDLIYGIRKVLLGIKPNKHEQDMLNKTLENKDVIDLIRKWFMPEIDGDSPLFQIVDFTQSLNLELKANKMADQMFIEIEAKNIEQDYINQRLAVLFGEKPKKDDITLEDLANLKLEDKEKVLINTIARCWLLAYIDSNLNQMKTLATSKEETLEEAKARLAKNSNK